MTTTAIWPEEQTAIGVADLVPNTSGFERQVWGRVPLGLQLLVADPSAHRLISHRERLTVPAGAQGSLGAAEELGRPVRPRAHTAVARRVRAQTAE